MNAPLHAHESAACSKDKTQGEVVSSVDQQQHEVAPAGVAYSSWEGFHEAVRDGSFYGVPHNRVRPVGEETLTTYEPNTETSNSAPEMSVLADTGERTMVVDVDIDDGDILTVGTWQDREVEMILDSGCCRHVLPPSEAAGYTVRDSPGSRRGQNFIVGNGEPVPNEGQVHLNLEADVGQGERRSVTSVFQVAELNCSLMSVSQICDLGCKCVFEKDHAKVVTQENEVICRFERDRNIYVTKMNLKAPAPFQRQDP